MKSKMQNRRGITFIEVMLALVILSVSLVAIFKTFLISLDRINYLTHRLVASNTIDNRLVAIERELRAHHILPFQQDQAHRVDMGSHVVEFEEILFLSEVEGLKNIFQCDLSFRWKQSGAIKEINRSTYLFKQSHD